MAARGGYHSAQPQCAQWTRPEFDRIDLLPRGSAVTITGIESDFCEIAWENGKAYVSVHYLAFDNAL